MKDLVEFFVLAMLAVPMLGIAFVLVSVAACAMRAMWRTAWRRE